MPTVYFDTYVNPDIFLPSLGNIEYCLKLVITETIECLKKNGISYVNESIPAPNSRISTPEESVRIILGTQSPPGPLPAENAGIFIFFTAGDPKSKRLATILSKNLGNIYPEPSLVKMMPIKKNKSTTNNSIPCVTAKIGYADNPDDMSWMRDNLENIATSLVISLSEYFEIPFTQCQTSDFGIVNHDTSIMQKPSLNSDIIENLHANTKVRIYGQWEDWYIIEHNQNLGYVQTRFITT